MTTRALRGINCTAKASTGAPTAGTWEVGDLVCDSVGTYYACTGAGTPGTWVALSTGGTPTLWGKPNSLVAVVSTGNATANAHHIVQPGADITITLPAAASNNGTVCAFEMRASGTIQATLDAGAGVLIAGRTRYLALVHTNVVMLYCNGTDWVPLLMCLETPWVNGGALTITATTTNPTKGTTSIDQLWWRRVGDTCECQIRYRQSTAGTAGAGDYLFGVPFTIDTGTHPTESTIGSVTEMYLLNAYGLPQATGALDINAGAGSTVVSIIPYSSSQIRIASVNNSNGSTDWWRSNWYNLSNTHVGANFGFAYKPSNW